MIDYGLFAELEREFREQGLKDEVRKMRLLEAQEDAADGGGLRAALAGVLLRIAHVIDGGAIARTAARQGGR